MFCTTLRRRPSFAPVIPTLTSPAVPGLRESQLTTHDLEVPIESSTDLRSRSMIPCRQLRVLLLSSSMTTKESLPETMERVKHFALLTGGENLVMVFLLDSRASEQNIEQTTAAAGHDDAGQRGIVAYAQLQAELMNHVDIPHIPLLPLVKLEGLTPLLKNHTTCLLRPILKPKSPTNPFILLQQCTANPPMSQQTAYILTDLFPNLRELSIACSGFSSAIESSSPSGGVTGLSSQPDDMPSSSLAVGTQFSHNDATAKLKQLRDLVGEQECMDIIDFWKEEWAID